VSALPTTARLRGPRTAEPSATPACSASGLHKAFGATPVLSGLDLEVATGSLTAVLGPSGCGKTTLLRLIAGFERADRGSIRVAQKLVCDGRTNLAPERRGVGFVAQEGALFPHLSVSSNVAFGLPRAERRSPRVHELLELVGLADLGARFPHELSGGQQQRVALARALAPSPGLVLLDEPFDALDAGLRAQVRVEVRDALRAAGATALLVTHDQQEALSLADVVAVMREGRIAQIDHPQTLYRDPVDAEVARFLGEAVLLPGELLGEHVQTPLGLLRTRHPPAGARLDERTSEASSRVTVMLRPEQILCSPPLADGLRGRVLGTEFYGHDATVRISLDDPACPEITARAAGHKLPQVGERVSVVVDGTALAYPRA
jgi:iron(III) transport system ATP-binding protein